MVQVSSDTDVTYSLKRQRQRLFARAGGPSDRSNTAVTLTHRSSSYAPVAWDQVPMIGVFSVSQLRMVGYKVD